MSNRKGQEVNNDPIVPMTFSLPLSKKKRLSDSVGGENKHSNKSELVNAAVDYYMKKKLHVR